MGNRGTKPTFASPSQAMDMQRLAGKLFLKMPQSKANKYLNSAEGQKQFINELSELIKLKLPVQNEHALITIPFILDYYRKVEGIDVSEILEMDFPEHEYLRAFMVMSPLHDEDQIMEAQQKYFHKKDGFIVATDEESRINLYKYMNPVAGNIDRKEETYFQKRPSGLYITAHSGEDKPDSKHRGKSYDDAVIEKMTIATVREYLRLNGLHKFTKGYFMDKAGWTRTASLWSDGFVVSGCWSVSDSKLYLSYGNRDYRFADNGPRELFLSL